MQDILVFNEEECSLKGKKGIILGVANRSSIAYGCAAAFRHLGAEVGLTYLNEKAKRFVEPVAEELESPVFMPCNVEEPGQLEMVFEEAEKVWGKIDFAVHSIAFATKDDLHGRVIDCSAEGFARAMDVSCHSFLRMSRLAEPLMEDGGSLFAMSYLGAERAVPNYNLMGPVKAALESCVRYLALELGTKGIRVHAISPGPIHTRAASGIQGFDDLAAEAESRTPMKQLAGIREVGMATAQLALPTNHLTTGSTLYVDGGYNIVG